MEPYINAFCRDVSLIYDFCTKPKPAIPESADVVNKKVEQVAFAFFRTIASLAMVLTTTSVISGVLLSPGSMGLVDLVCNAATFAIAHDIYCMMTNIIDLSTLSTATDHALYAAKVVTQNTRSILFGNKTPADLLDLKDQLTKNTFFPSVWKNLYFSDKSN